MTVYTNILSPIISENSFCTQYPIHSAAYQDGVEDVKQACEGKTFEPINLKATPYELTPLHVATIKGNIEAMEILLHAGADPNLQDLHGWTPLHHAAVKCDEAVINILLANQADETIQNHRGGTYKHLQELVTLPKLQTAGPAVVQNADGSLQTIQGMDLFRWLKGMFSNEVYTPPEVLVKDWSSLNNQMNGQSINSKDMNQEKIKRYEAFRSKPIDLFLSKTHTTETGEKIADIGIGVFANRDYQAGEYVCEYIGEDTGKELPNTTHLMGTIDGNTKRHIVGYGTLAQTSHPNCQLDTIENIRGRPVRYVLQACEEIKQGDPIVWDYGAYHEIKFGKFHELRGASLEKFIKEHSIHDLKKEIKKFDSLSQQEAVESIEKDPILSRNLMKFLYVANSPHAFLDYFFREIVSVEDLDAIGALAEHTILSEHFIMGGLEGFKIYKRLNKPFMKEIVKKAVYALLREGEVAKALHLCQDLPKMQQKNVFAGNKEKVEKNFKQWVAKIK